jgi:hypothetical protein
VVAVSMHGQQRERYLQVAQSLLKGEYGREAGQDDDDDDDDDGNGKI